ncbi:type II secretion system F family protein [Legionella londiniensis]|uniref:Pilus assembly protein PilC n=1 Tax=Legionella londiniensis TaxID=45068 RepID=A0A0W0VIF1_9GAMM|nr:type II secretion system F family protein [Legionella londiniensis]KTD19900.1 pilus assembly protein PilC [Legionella londiniensis]STX94228.1 type IV pilus assembly protein PilC [Legionella londiniensis]
MPEFQYTARDQKGNEINGRRRALTAEDLAGQLQNESLIPLDIKLAGKTQEKKHPAFELPKLFKPKVSQEELQMFCRQMYSVLKAGVPISIAVERLAETARDKTLANVLQQTLASLNQGHSLYLSLSQFPDIFSDFFINLVKVGESTGRLEQAFLHLAEYIDLKVETQKKIKSALRYPILVLVATVVALIVINAFVIPAFAALFAQFKGDLPLMTRILIASSNFLTSYWYIALLMVLTVIIALRYYIKTPEGELQWGRLELKLPVVGWLIHRIILARFARLYALVLRSGLSAVEGIELVGNSIGNAFVAKKIKAVGTLIARGNSISLSIAQTHLFSPLVIQMITLGEETGTIDELLDEVADFYQREIDYDLVRLSDAIEPIMLSVMAVMVLILALGVFLPMWQLAGQVRG